jgi:hypothetical protein
MLVPSVCIHSPITYHCVCSVSLYSQPNILPLCLFRQFVFTAQYLTIVFVPTVCIHSPISYHCVCSISLYSQPNILPLCLFRQFVFTAQSLNIPNSCNTQFVNEAICKPTFSVKLPKHCIWTRFTDRMNIVEYQAEFLKLEL